MELYNLVSYHKVTNLLACMDVIQYASGNLVTCNGHCMELYNLVSYHKVIDLLACIDVIQYTSSNR